ncbi:MAG TPA: glycosyltransferase family 39 protein [Ktedonobacteraceae bacterium]
MQGPSLYDGESTLDAPDDISLLSTQPVLHSTPISPVPPAPNKAVTQDTQKRSAFAQIWKEALLPYLGTRLLVFVVGLFATYYIMPRLAPIFTLPNPAANMAFPQSLWLMWQHFDSGFYLQIIKYGYAPASSLQHQDNWVFYPLYPLLMNGVGKLLGGSEAAYSIAGVLISNIAGAGMMTYLYLLVRREFNARVASRTVIYLALFPTAFFFSAIFTESLLLGLCIACIYYTRRQLWWLAGICGGLAALTRLQGVTLLVPLAWEYLRVVSARYAPLPTELPARRLERAKIVVNCYLRGLLLAARVQKNWLNALALLLVPCGLLAFMVYGQIHINDFFATFHASAWGWRRHVSPPWRLLIYSLRNPILGQPMNWNFWVLNITTALAGLAVLIWSWRRLPMAYTLYTAVMVLLPLTSSLLNSYGRYALLIFPAFILLASFTSKTNGKEGHLHTFIVASFAALEAVFMIFFVLGFPTIA